MRKILFYIAQEYYWASLEPIYQAFAEEGNFDLYIKVGKNQQRFLKLFLLSRRKEIENRFTEAGYKVTRETEGFDAVFCGAQVNKPERFGTTLLCNMDHGPGIKTLRYRHLLKQKNVKYYCFVEGQYRIEKFKKYRLDQIHDVYDTGLPKLDKLFNGTLNREHLIREFNIHPDKKTVLYAPSYKPTSIFMVGEEIAALTDTYNVIIKLHPYSWSGKYASHSHHRFFEKLVKKYPEIQLVGPDHHDILPYMFIADTMISDGSSVINEFLALGKCGIIFNLPDDSQTHSDGKPLLENKSSEWLQNSFIHINSGNELRQAVMEAISPSPERKEQLLKDKKYIFTHTDGQSARRVKQIVESLLRKNKGDTDK